MMDNTDPTRRYTIEVKDLVSNETVMLALERWADRCFKCTGTRHNGAPCRAPGVPIVRPAWAPDVPGMSASRLGSPLII